MRPFILTVLALSACARPMSAPVAGAHTHVPREAAPLSLSRLDLGAATPRSSRAPCRIGPSELECETKHTLASQFSKGAPELSENRQSFAITREGGALIYAAQALRTGVSQARRRSSLPVTARK